TYVTGEDLRAETSGLRVQREYFRRLRARNINGKEFEKAVSAGRDFHSGDEILVRLTIEVRDPNHKGECREVVLHDPLPAGCEAVDEPENEDEGYEVPATGGKWWDAAEQRREVRDKEVIFYASYLRPGKNVFHYRIHAAQPGNY